MCSVLTRKSPVLLKVVWITNKKIYSDIKWKLLLLLFFFFFNSSILSKVGDCDQSLTAKAQNLCWQKVGLLSAVSSQSSFSPEEVRIC